VALVAGQTTQLAVSEAIVDVTASSKPRAISGNGNSTADITNRKRQVNIAYAFELPNIATLPTDCRLVPYSPKSSSASPYLKPYLPNNAFALSDLLCALSYSDLIFAICASCSNCSHSRRTPCTLARLTRMEQRSWSMWRYVLEMEDRGAWEEDDW
jgi:hypothetical protein